MSFATILHASFVSFAAIAVAPHPAPRSSILVTHPLPASRPKTRSFSSRTNLVSAWPPGQYMDQNGSRNAFLIEESSPPSVHSSTNGSRYRGQLSVSRSSLSSGVRWSRVISVLLEIASATSRWFRTNLASGATRLSRRMLSHASFALLENFRANRSRLGHMSRLIIAAIFET